MEQGNKKIVTLLAIFIFIIWSQGAFAEDSPESGEELLSVGKKFLSVADIEELFKEGDVVALGEVSETLNVDTLNGREISEALFKKLGASDTELNRELIGVIIGKKNPKTLRLLAEHTFSQEPTKEMKGLISKTIDTAKELRDRETLHGLTRYT